MPKPVWLWICMGALIALIENKFRVFSDQYTREMTGQNRIAKSMIIRMIWKDNKIYFFRENTDV